MKTSFPLTRSALALTLLTVLSSCSSITESSKVNYKTEGETKVVPLDIPPDLTQLTRDTRYAIPSSAVTANSLGTRKAPATITTAAKQVNDVRIERDGNQRWLVVNRSVDEVWPIVQSFWQENGFEYVIEQPQIGLLETEWAENRAKIPQDFIRRTIGKVFDNLYSSGLRDKFRTRIERNNKGGVDIFITHRGMSEEYKDQSKNNTVWVPRPNDPELEVEFLSRLMLKLGTANEQIATKPEASNAVVLPKTTFINQGDTTLLSIPDSFDVTWRRVGLALDRTGFTVEDRNRTKGLYFVRYVDTTSTEETGFFNKIFSSSESEAGPVKYRIVVRSVGTISEVSIQNADGSATGNTPTTQRILKLLDEGLR